MHSQPRRLYQDKRLPTDIVKQTDKQRDRQTDKETDRQTKRQTDKETAQPESRQANKTHKKTASEWLLTCTRPHPLTSVLNVFFLLLLFQVSRDIQGSDGNLIFFERTALFKSLRCRHWRQHSRKHQSSTPPHIPKRRRKVRCQQTHSLANRQYLKLHISSAARNCHIQRERERKRERERGYL